VGVGRGGSVTDNDCSAFIGKLERVKVHIDANCPFDTFQNNNINTSPLSRTVGYVWYFNAVLEYRVP
jgi:hypothetical protein